MGNKRRPPAPTKFVELEDEDPDEEYTLSNKRNPAKNGSPSKQNDNVREKRMIKSPAKRVQMEDDDEDSEFDFEQASKLTIAPQKPSLS